MALTLPDVILRENVYQLLSQPGYYNILAVGYVLHSFPLNVLSGPSSPVFDLDQQVVLCSNNLKKKNTETVGSDNRDRKMLPPSLKFSSNQNNWLSSHLLIPPFLAMIKMNFNMPLSSTAYY